MTTDIDVHDLFRQLTEDHTHREPYVVKVKETAYGRHHVTDVPAMVRQLVDSDPYRNPGGDNGGVYPTSRPTARIEAMDTVMLIDDEAGEWIDRLGGIIPADPIDPDGTLGSRPAEGTVLRLLRLHGLEPSTETCGADDLIVHMHPDAEPCTEDDKHPHRKAESEWCCQRGRLQNDVRRWWHQARIITGWDMAAWVPDNTCPAVECGERRKLRVRLDSAMCVACRTVWAADQLGLLAEHIRAENRDEELPAREVV